ncbi:hypothetical protein SteCoe_36636 [Stentor coeruleus]|uniref:Peptidase M14 domain-containing protein n=1 Tax=Stentor coeruleus TaxID=5963 RepID=A0A1R2APV0_9CILI|nr:hypothetical protein SteCoe_36636 [Stentor coeruleus]
MFMAIQMICFLCFTFVASSSPSLSGYYSYLELTLKMNELLDTYPEIISSYSDVGGLRLNSPISAIMPKSKILMIGGLYGGYPIDAYQVIYILESLAKAYTSNDTAVIKAVDCVIIDFLPVLNEGAYIESEVVFNETGSFQVIYTDLKNETICPNNSWAGTNLDRNFPMHWTPNNDPCSNDYSGKESLSSTLLTWAYNANNEDFYDFIVNFQGDGNYYAYPSAYQYLEHSPLEEYLYERVMSAIPNNYYSGQMADIIGTPLNGTLLDYLGDKHFTIQVAIGDNNKLIEASAIDTEVDKHYKLVLAEIISRYSQVSAYFVKSEEFECEIVNCTYYSNVTVEFEIINNSTVSTTVSLLVDITFDLNSSFSSPEIICSGLKIYDNSSYEVACIPFANGFDINSQKLYALSSMTIQLSYIRYNKTNDNDTFIYDGTFANDNLNSGEHFSGIKEIGDNAEDNTDFENDDNNVSESTKNGLIIGLILGFAFLILVIIVVCVLCRRKKSEQSEQSNKA